MNSLQEALNRAGAKGHVMFQTPMVSTRRHRCLDCGRILQLNEDGIYVGAALKIKCAANGESRR